MRARAGAVQSYPGGLGKEGAEAAHCWSEVDGMNRTDGEQIGSGWTGLAQEVEQELRAWRRAHPRATLTEIEGAVQAGLRRLQARYLQDLVQASGTATWRTSPPAERPSCGSCGARLEPVGPVQERQVLTTGQAEPLRVQRQYGTCPTCGVGLFPPGPRTGAAPG